MARDTVCAAINGDLGAWRRRRPVPLDNGLPGRCGREDRAALGRYLHRARCVESRQPVLQLLKPRDQISNDRLRPAPQGFRHRLGYRPTGS